MVLGPLALVLCPSVVHGPWSEALGPRTKDEGQTLDEGRTKDEEPRTKD
jgi:hypothetical protein